MNLIKVAGASVVVLAGLLVFVGCSSSLATEKQEPATTASTATDGEFINTAMVVTFGDGEILFVDQDTDTPYFPTLPEGTPELTAGNIVRVTGNGIMLESYPGQYSGITRVEVIKEGTPADAEKYANIVAEIWQPKDPAELPYVSIEYTTELAVTSVMLPALNYVWNYNQDGEVHTTAEDAQLPNQVASESLPDVRVDAPTEVTANFDVNTTSVSVLRWSEDALNTEGEAVPVSENDLSFVVEPEYRYAIFSTFEQGEVTYAFTVL